MKKIVLAILDGVGISPQKIGNAVTLAKPNFLNKCFLSFPNSQLLASEQSVGLPTGQMGNSEVGHTNIGAGRIVPQKLMKINNEIEDKSFFANKNLSQLFANLQKSKNTLHLLGLLSDGGVHSHISHLFALIDYALKYDIKSIIIHPFLDGRDTEPSESIKYLDELQKKIANYKNISIATISGRYFAMDRELHWQRTNLSYQAIAYAKAPEYDNYQSFYTSTNQTIEDEFVQPMLVDKNYEGVKQGDALLFFNFRADRMRQLCYAFSNKQLDTFEHNFLENISVYTLTNYGDEMRAFGVVPILEDEIILNTLTETLCNNNKKVLKIAESTKYAHVTYFLNGGMEHPFDNEDRILIPSDNIATFDLMPKMKAPQICKKTIEAIKTSNYDAIVLNFANGDMVGHSGNLKATVKSIKTIDKQLSKIYKTALRNDYILVITADHGNAEKMLDDKGQKWTAHTLNPVPFIICNKSYKISKSNYSLANIAPTLLDIMSLPIPQEMTAKSMLEKNN